MNTSKKMAGAAGTPNSQTSAADQKKLRRITRACDYCHKRSIRCRFPGDVDPARCQNCIDFDQPCQFERAVKRRGAKPRTRAASAVQHTPTPNVPAVPTPAAVIVKQEAVYIDVCRTPSIAQLCAPPEWKAPDIASQAVIMDLVEIYFEICYPNFPFFHRPTFLRRIARGEYTNNRFSFGVTMAMCALVSARIADRAVFNPHWDIRHLSQVKSEVFYAAAVRECGNAGALKASNLDLLRTCALLAVVAIQYGRFRELQTHLGKYHVLVSMDGLHDEENWPQNIGIIEKEERRRLFWSMYCLDIFSSIMWNGVIRCREQQSNVSYTTELDDEHFDDFGYRFNEKPADASPMVIGPSPTHPTLNIRTSSWLCGWNFTTDLYRVMEHVITHFRDKRRHKRSFLNDIFGESPAVPAANVRDSIMAMYNNLPQCFKETQPITCDASQDRYGFQAANITATVQLLRMVLFASAGATIEDRCKIASEVVDAFMRIPVQYLQAISSPMLHHLAGIGSILGSVFEESLSESGYLQVRVVLLALAQLLENLDHGLHSTASAEKLRSIVSRVDAQMEKQRRSFAVGVGINTSVGGGGSLPHPAAGVKSPNEKGEAGPGSIPPPPHATTNSPYVYRRTDTSDSGGSSSSHSHSGSGSGSGSATSSRGTGNMGPPLPASASAQPTKYNPIPGTGIPPDQAQKGPSEQLSIHPTALAIPSDFLDEWPWSFDFMQFPETG